MKLKFKVSQSTNLHPQIITGKIVSLLDDGKYRVNHVTDSRVEFDENPWKLMWNFEAAKRLDGGKFEISMLNNEVLITFTWYKNLMVTVLILAALSITLIHEGEYYAPLFFVAFYIIAISINIVTLRSIAREMLNKIVK
jgi:hypothetical protein